VSAGIDLDNLGAPQIVPDDGSAQSDPPADLLGGLPGAQLAQDSIGQLTPGLDLLNSVGNTAPINQDQGPAYGQTTLDADNLGPVPIVPDSILDTWFKMTGFDTVALQTITWLGHTPLTPPPSQNPVINISAVRLAAFLPEEVV
jgi:hypothetical protein